MSKYLALTAFSYPVHKGDRDKIRKNLLEKYVWVGVEVKHVVMGEEVVPPQDLLKGWLESGLIGEFDDATK